LINFSDKSKWNLLYRASVDGFGASDFHRKCDNHPNTLTIIKTTNNYIFGGFTSQTWNGSNYKSYVDEFLFSYKNPYNIPCKINGTPNSQKAIYCNPSYGPTFGGGNDIHISSNSNTNSSSYSKLNNTYKINNGHDSNFLTGSRNFTVSEIEIFSKYN